MPEQIIADLVVIHDDHVADGHRIRERPVAARAEHAPLTQPTIRSTRQREHRPGSVDPGDGVHHRPHDVANPAEIVRHERIDHVLRNPIPRRQPARIDPVQGIPVHVAVGRSHQGIQRISGQELSGGGVVEADVVRVSEVSHPPSSR
jgi:hypothetical protein